LEKLSSSVSKIKPKSKAKNKKISEHSGKEKDTVSTPRISHISNGVDDDDTKTYSDDDDDENDDDEDSEEEENDDDDDSQTFDCGNTPLLNDVKIEFYETTFSKTVGLFHFWFNTTFVENHHLNLEQSELDKANKDKHHKTYPKGFKIELFFKRGLTLESEGGNSHTNLLRCSKV